MADPTAELIARLTQQAGSLDPAIEAQRAQGKEALLAAMQPQRNGIGTELAKSLALLLPALLTHGKLNQGNIAAGGLAAQKQFQTQDEEEAKRRQVLGLYLGKLANEQADTLLKQKGHYQDKALDVEAKKAQSEVDFGEQKQLKGIEFQNQKTLRGIPQAVAGKELIPLTEADRALFQAVLGTAPPQGVTYSGAEIVNKLAGTNLRKEGNELNNKAETRRTKQQEIKVRADALKIAGGAMGIAPGSEPIEGFRFNDKDKDKVIEAHNERVGMIAAAADQIDEMKNLIKQHGTFSASGTPEGQAVVGKWGTLKAELLQSVSAGGVLARQGLNASELKIIRDEITNFGESIEGARTFDKAAIERLDFLKKKLMDKAKVASAHHGIKINKFLTLSEIDSLPTASKEEGVSDVEQYISEGTPLSSKETSSVDDDINQALKLFGAE